MKKIWSSVLLIAFFLIGLSLLLYPTVSNWWNSLHASGVIVDYEAVQKKLTKEDYEAFFREAEEYNREILQTDFPLMYYDRVAGYEQLLNPGGNSVMGYITIPKIRVKLPILHGTSEGVLQKAIGHLEGTSLPTGGEGNHCVLSAHRGLPSARLFTDLDQMDLGDQFVLTVLDRELTYEIDQILIVEPQEVDALYAVEGKDYCTLVTCTPYGVNSHRLLVRGARIEPQKTIDIVITADALPQHSFAASGLLIVPVFIIWLMFCLKYMKRGKV